MEDAITDVPPPSRFFPDDLNIFISPPSPLPPPFLVVPTPTSPLHTSLLLIAISTPSLHLVHNHLPHKTLIGTLVLPEASHSSPLSSCHIYSVSNSDALIVALQYKVAPERARAVAKALQAGIKAERVAVFDGIRAGNFRGRVDVEEGMVFKLESEEERRRGVNQSLKAVEYLPTGSMMDGIGAAVLAECQMRKVRGTIVATWPENEKIGDNCLLVLGKVRNVVRDFLPEVDLGDSATDAAAAGIRVSTGGNDFDLYT